MVNWRNLRYYGGAPLAAFIGRGLLEELARTGSREVARAGVGYVKRKLIGSGSRNTTSKYRKSNVSSRLPMRKKWKTSKRKFTKRGRTKKGIPKTLSGQPYKFKQILLPDYVQKSTPGKQVTDVGLQHLNLYTQYDLYNYNDCALNSYQKMFLEWGEIQITCSNFAPVDTVTTIWPFYPRRQMYYSKTPSALYTQGEIDGDAGSTSAIDTPGYEPYFNNAFTSYYTLGKPTKYYLKAGKTRVFTYKKKLNKFINEIIATPDATSASGPPTDALPGFIEGLSVGFLIRTVGTPINVGTATPDTRTTAAVATSLMIRKRFKFRAIEGTTPNYFYFDNPLLTTDDAQDKVINPETRGTQTVGPSSSVYPIA